MGLQVNQNVRMEENVSNWGPGETQLKHCDTAHSPRALRDQSKVLAQKCHELFTINCKTAVLHLAWYKQVVPDLLLYLYEHIWFPPDRSNGLFIKATENRLMPVFSYLLLSTEISSVWMKQNHIIYFHVTLQHRILSEK